MPKKNTYLLVSTAIIVSLASFWLIQFNSNKRPIKTVCSDKDYKIPLTLQSGEVGDIYLTENHCELSPDKSANNLSFKVLADGGIEDSLYQSKLYIWQRNAALTLTAQIEDIAYNKFSKNKLCQLERNLYPQHDGLITYALAAKTKAGDEASSKIDCLLFSKAADFSAEIFMETNDLLILQRQDGLDGIEPFNLSSLRFVKS